MKDASNWLTNPLTYGCRMPSLQIDQAQSRLMAVQAMEWLCAQDDLLARFLGESGASPQDLRVQLGQPGGPDTGFLSALLDTILARDSDVIACAAALGIRPEALAQGAMVLAGPASRHWT
jgi:hypothetical protein